MTTVNRLRAAPWDVADWGGGIYAVRGHVSISDFAAAVAAFNGDDVAPQVAWVCHDWNRYIPGEDGGYIDATPSSRGAFRLTRGLLAAYRED